MQKERFRLQVKAHFDAAHYIRDYVGKCSREHGHRFEVEAVFEGSKLDERNMLIDFGDVKRVLNNIIDGVLDHYKLNETLHEPNVTAEFLARYIYKRLEQAFVWEGSVAVIPAVLKRVTVWESPECCVKYYEEDESTK